MPTFKKASLILNAIQKSSGPGKDWIWLHLPPSLWDCFSEEGIDIGCLIDPWTDGGGGGEGGGGGLNCNEAKTFEDCPLLCNDAKSCGACCDRIFYKCFSKGKKTADILE